MIPARRPRMGPLVGLAIVATILAYLPGLSGPLLLDDFGNLADVYRFLDGERTWQFVLLNNHSGPTGRPIAMASFLFDALLWGRSTWHWKLTNLIIHCASGLALFFLLRRLLRRDPRLSNQAWVPWLLTAIWMLLPINVSSVLYLVQRMAMLSALFALLALLAYVAGREHLEAGRARRAAMLILVAFPVLVCLSFFSKENGLLAVPMAAVIELTLFRARPRAWQAYAFLTITLWIPVAVAVAVVITEPDFILGPYAWRDFTLWERILTQPRILWQYVANILVPYSPRLGVFHDTYEKSISLTAPWTTLAALAGWAAALGLAWRLRNSHPLILCGILLFLVGHAMESSILGLELYFEHRNYLPGFGALLATAATIAAAMHRMPEPTPLFRRAAQVLLLVLACIYGVATHGRAVVWSSMATLYAQELRNNPNSPRLHSNLLGLAMRAGDLDRALYHINVSEANLPDRERMTHTIWRFVAYCRSGVAVPEALYEAFERNLGADATSYAMVAWEDLALRAEPGSCKNLDRRRIADLALRWIENSGRPKQAHQVWRSRYYVARLLASTGSLSEAAEVGAQAWQDSSYMPGIGVFLFQVNASLGHTDTCRNILDRLEKHSGSGDTQLDAAISAFSAHLQTGTPQR